MRDDDLLYLPSKLLRAFEDMASLRENLST